VCTVGEELTVAACSADFAAEVGAADPQQALRGGLLSQLRRRAERGGGEHLAEAKATLASLAEAAREGRAAHGVLVVGEERGRGSGGDEPPQRPLSLLFVAVAPMRHDERDLFAVLLADLASDPAQPLGGRAALHASRNAVPVGSWTPRRRGGGLGFACMPELLCGAAVPMGAGRGQVSDEALSHVLTAALHAFPSVGFSLADTFAHDLPVVWVSRGFAALSGYNRAELIGYNCRKLQGEGTDPDSVVALGDAIRAGRGVRRMLFNYAGGAPSRGFWNCVSLFPHLEAGAVRYYISLNLRLSREERKQIVRLERLLPTSPPEVEGGNAHSGGSFSRPKMSASKTAQHHSDASSKENGVYAVREAIAQGKAEAPNHRPNKKSSSCTIL